MCTLIEQEMKTLAWRMLFLGAAVSIDMSFQLT